MQIPSATHVASFRSWKRDIKRCARKGDKGIEILVLILIKDEDVDEERHHRVGFRVNCVFDVNLTDWEPPARPC